MTIVEGLIFVTHMIGNGGIIRGVGSRRGRVNIGSLLHVYGFGMRLLYEISADMVFTLQENAVYARCRYVSD